MKFIKILFSLSIILLLCGCFDYTEPDEIAYVVAVGIDKTENDDAYNYTIQFARPSQITGGSSESGGSGKETTGTVNVDAPSLYTAVNLANHVVSKKFTLSHIKIIVISDEVAKDGILSIIDSIGRSSDIRPSVYMCVSKGKANKYLSSVKPTIEINPVKYYNLIFENSYSSYIPVNDTQEIYFNFKNELKQNVLPLVGVAKGEEEKKGNSDSSSDTQGSEENQSGEAQSSEKESSGGESSGENSSGGNSSGGNSSGGNSGSSSEDSEKSITINQSGFEYRMKEYLAGNLDIKKKNSSEAIGGAIFKGDKMIGEIYGIEAELYNLLNGTYSEGFSSIFTKESPDDIVTVRLDQKRIPSVDVDINDGEIVINTKIYLEGNFIQTPQDSFLEDDLLSFETETGNYMKESLLKFLNKTQKEFDSDILGYGNFAKRAFWTNKSFEELNWNENYKNARFNVDVEFNIRRTGLIIKTKKGGK